MNLIAKLKLIAAIPVMLLIFSGLVYFVTERHVAESNQKALLADDIVKTAQDICVLIFELRGHPEERPRRQLRGALASLGELLKTAEPIYTSNDEKDLAELINRSYAAAGRNLQELEALPDTSGASALRGGGAYAERLHDRLLVEIQSIIPRAGRLNEINHLGALEHAKTQGVLTLVFFAALALCMPAISAFMIKGVAAPLGRLQKGVRSLTNGGLEKPIPVETDDELGRLTEAFNEMAANLVKARAELEQRVADRTADLTASNERLIHETAERASAELSLRESRRTAFALINAIIESVLLLDPDGTIVMANETMAARFGASADELIGADVYRLIPDDVGGSRREKMRQVVETGKAVAFEDVRLGRNILNSLYPVFDEKGEVVRIAVFGIDMTERKKNERDLFIFRLLMDEINDAVFINNAETSRILDVNQTAIKRLGYSREELLAMRVVDIEAVLPDDFSWKMHMAELDEKGFMVMEGGHRRKDGIVIPVEISVRNVVCDDYKFNVAVVRDITDRKRADQMVRLKTEELDRFFNVTLDLLCIVDTGGRFRRLNRAWETTLGYGLDELMEGKFLDFIHPDDLQPTIEAVSALAAQKEVINFVNRYRCKDGSYRWLEWRSAPSGELVYAAARDITDRKNSEAEMSRLVATLERSNRELEQFAYVASHDLQEPLRKIAGFTELLAGRYKGKLDGKADTYIEYILDGANRMKGLINDLLMYSRVMTRGKEPAPTDCNAVMARTLGDLEFMIRDNNAEVSFDELPVVSADGTQIGQLFQNLIGNAVKYHGEAPPRVHVRAERKEDAWLFSVQDNGIGFEPRFADRIFEIFQRLHTRAEYTGTGIGLAVCKKIVERHGGRIWAESEPGRGSIFYFTLPLKRRREEMEREEKYGV